MQAFFVGLSPAVMGLIAVVSLELISEPLVDWWAIAIADDQDDEHHEYAGHVFGLAAALGESAARTDM